MKERLAPDCGQWPDLVDNLGAIILLAQNFQEILVPEAGQRLCPKFNRLPQGMSYLAADARIIHRLICRHAARGSSFRLTSTDLTWIAEQNPFQECTGQSQNGCSCNLVQVLRKCVKAKGLLTYSTLGTWQHGAVIFGDRHYRPKRNTRLTARSIVEAHTDDPRS